MLLRSLVLLAVLLACRAFKKTGLGKRLAYILLSKFGEPNSGRSSLGLGYVMMLCDLILVRPRVQYVPFCHCISYFPGRLRVTGFLSGQGSAKAGRISGAAGTCSGHVHSSIVSDRNGINAVIASTIKDIAGVELTWMLWFRAALVPGLIVCVLCPLVVYKLYPPQMKDLGDIKPFVVSKMQEMGAMKKDENSAGIIYHGDSGMDARGEKLESMYVVAFAFWHWSCCLGHGLE